MAEIPKTPPDRPWWQDPDSPTGINVSRSGYHDPAEFSTPEDFKELLADDLSPIPAYKFETGFDPDNLGDQILEVHRYLVRAQYWLRGRETRPIDDAGKEVNAALWALGDLAKAMVNRDQEFKTELVGALGSEPPGNNWDYGAVPYFVDLEKKYLNRHHQVDQHSSGSPDSAAQPSQSL